MSRASHHGGDETRVMQERAIFAAELEPLTPEKCRDCPALSFLAMRLTTRVVSGDIAREQAMSLYGEGAALCPRLTNLALRDVVRPDCSVDKPILNKLVQ